MAKINNKYEYYNNEMTYVSPTEVSKEAIDKIKSRRIGMSVLDAFSL